MPEGEKENFLRSVITAHTSSPEYRFAETAEKYYRRKNETIMNFRKLLYTVTGKQIPDNYSTNYKLRSNWFNYFTSQLNQYLLSNGVTWADDATKETLGPKFDTQLKKLSRYALVQRAGFGFWNLDHLEPYGFLEFAPLYDEETGALMAGARFWRLDESRPLRATMFEPDGYTEYIWRTDTSDGKETGDILREKRPYIQVTRTTEAEGTEIYDGQNYPTFPVVPLYGIDKQSELEGRQELIDCFDLIESGFANTVEEASYIYWAINNAEGMHEIDLAKFVERVKTMHTAFTGGGNGAHAEPHSLEAPYSSRSALLNELREALFYSFKAFDAKQIQSSGAVIAQIDAAYEALDQKASDYEDNIFEFLDGIMAVTGIDDKPTLTRSKISNTGEQIQNVLQSAEYTSSDYTTKKLLTLLGDGDLADDMIKQMEDDEAERLRGAGFEDEEYEEQPGDYEEEEHEDIDTEEDDVDMSTSKEIMEMLEKLLKEL